MGHLSPGWALCKTVITKDYYWLMIMNNLQLKLATATWFFNAQILCINDLTIHALGFLCPYMAWRWRWNRWTESRSHPTPNAWLYFLYCNNRTMQSNLARSILIPIWMQQWREGQISLWLTDKSKHSRASRKKKNRKNSTDDYKISVINLTFWMRGCERACFMRACTQHACALSISSFVSVQNKGYFNLYLVKEIEKILAVLWEVTSVEHLAL